MNDLALTRATQKAARRKFYGNKTLHAKGGVRFPTSLSDEYERTAGAYMDMLNAVLRNHLPQIRRAIDAERSGMRMDDDFTVSRMIRQVMERAQVDFERRARHFGLERRLETLAGQMRRQSVREWRRVVHRTLGINILEDYYSGEFFRHTLRTWTESNINLIKTLPGKSLTRMQNIIQGGYLQGKSNAEMSRLIQEVYGVERDRATFWARDQTAKLNADLTKAQQRDAGVEEYVWSDSGDSRVRDAHAHFHGKTFRWDDPPEMWYMTKRRGRVFTGRRCHPGEDYNCRCVARPVFKIDTLNLPMEGGSL